MLHIEESKFDYLVGSKIDAVGTKQIVCMFLGRCLVELLEISTKQKLLIFCFLKTQSKYVTFCSQVHAKHEEKSESKSVYREYNREFLLPKGTNPESIKSSLSKDGVLTVEAPLPALGAPEKMIPIAQN